MGSEVLHSSSSMDSLVCELSPISTFIWRIQNFSKLEDKRYDSDIFIVGGRKWQVQIYPMGDEEAKDHLILYLWYAEYDSTNKSSYAEYDISVIDQTDKGKTVTKDRHQFFTTDHNFGWGYDSFIPLNQLNDPSKGYLVNDTCIIRLEITAEEKMKEFTQASPKEQVVVEHPGAGQPYTGGRKHQNEGVVLDDKFQDVGGFAVLKTQATIYKKVWLKYGNIACSQVPIASSYIGQVWLQVSDIMGCVMDIQQCCLSDVSSEMIDLWEYMLNLEKVRRSRVEEIEMMETTRVFRVVRYNDLHSL